MGKTLGIDRETARRIKRMTVKELDGYLGRVTEKSYGNGYEEGLADMAKLLKQALDAALGKCVEDGALPQTGADEIKKAVSEHILKELEE